MKRLLVSVLAAAFVMSMSTAAFVLSAPVEKLKGGFMSVISSPLEIKDQTMTELKASHYHPFALVGGFLKGTAYMIQKAVSGVVDIVTFPIK